MNTPAPLNSFRVRPRFTEVVEGERAAVRARLLASLRREPAGLEVRPFDEFIGIHIAATERRYWSPRLFLSLEPEEAGRTRIEGTYGPEIEVWSVFLYGYLSAGMLGALSAVYGGAQRFVGADPWAFYVTGSMAVIMLGLYLAAQLGQKFGAVQTFRLHEAYTRAVTSG